MRLLCDSYTVLAISNCVQHDGTSYAVLKHVEMEFWCGMCRCDTGTQCWYTGSMSRLPTLVLECSKESHLERRACQKELKFGFLWGKKRMEWPEIFTEESWPTGPPFAQGFTPWVLWCHAEALKNPVSGLRGCHVLWSYKKKATGWHFDVRTKLIDDSWEILSNKLN